MSLSISRQLQRSFATYRYKFRSSIPGLKVYNNVFERARGEQFKKETLNFYQMILSNTEGQNDNSSQVVGLEQKDQRIKGRFYKEHTNKGHNLIPILRNNFINSSFSFIFKNHFLSC